MAHAPLPASDLEEERLLVESAKAGNLDAMRPIFEKYTRPLYAAVLMPKLGDPSAAEEVLRDTLATAIQKLDKFTWTGTSIFAWLRTIAVNKAYDYHRRNARSRKLIEAVSLEAQASAQHSQAADAALIAEQERQASQARISEALEHLNERYKRAIVLRLMEEHPREECASKMDISVATFDVVFHRAVRAFRKQFGEREQ